MRMRVLLLCSAFVLLALPGRAEKMNSRFGHVYWGLGPNLSLLGNLRVGFSDFELGLIQGTGAGVMWVQRTASPVFLQLGVAGTNGGTGLIGGGGFEWNTSSYFRLRTDITVSTDSALQTQSFVSVGGVFVL